MVRIWTLLKISILTNLRYKANFIFESISSLIPIIPAVTMLYNGNGEILGFRSAQEYAVYLLFAMAVWSFVEALWSFAFEMRSQMKQGILDETLMMPCSITELLIGWSMDGIVSTVVNMLPLIFTGILIQVFNTTVLHFVLSLVIVLITVFAGYCFALILMAMMTVHKETDQFVSFLGNIAPFVCGVIIPFIRLPHLIQIIGFLMPYTWALDLLRMLMFHYPSLLPAAAEAALLITQTTAYYILGKWMFHALYKKSRRGQGIIGY